MFETMYQEAHDPIPNQDHRGSLSKVSLPAMLVEALSPQIQVTVAQVVALFDPLLTEKYYIFKNVEYILKISFSNFFL